MCVCLWQNGKHAVNLALWNEARRINAEKWWKVAALSGENYHNSSNISTNNNSNTNNNISNNSTNNNSSTNNISNSWKMRRRPWCLVSCENARSSNWEIVQMCQNRRKLQDVICSSIGLWWVVSHRWHTLRATNLSTRTMPDKYWNNDCWPPIQQHDIWLWLLNYTSLSVINHLFHYTLQSVKRGYTNFVLKYVTDKRRRGKTYILTQHH